MPLIETKGAASAQGFGLSLGSSQAAISNYIEDVFSTYLYTGNGSTQTITNGIDLDGEGGLVFVKSRINTGFPSWFDTVRGPLQRLQSSSILQEGTVADSVSSFNTDGFSVGSALSASGENYVSWTFRKQPKFFDVVTYTGNSTNRDISHSLGSVPGLIVVKRTDNTGRWFVYHKDIPNTSYMQLNSTAASVTGVNVWNNTSPTSTHFRVGINTEINTSGGTYVAYLFAHDAGEFGLTGTDNVISCGSYTGNGSATGPTVTLGWEPQWLLVKCSSSTGDWNLIDNMRGFTVGGTDAELNPNLTNAESTGTFVTPTATGFQVNTTDAGYNTSSATYIYIAIRRGLMKVPTSGASVFSPVVYTGTNLDYRLVNTGIVTDMAMARILDQSSTGGFYSSARLIADNFLPTAQVSTQVSDFDSFMTSTVNYGNSFSAINGFGVGNDAARLLNQSSTQQLAYAFRRAAGFFDVVCYTGTGVNRTVDHNLGAIPQLIIVKVRSTNGGWVVYSAPSGATKYQYLNSTIVATTYAPTWNNTEPTSSVFTVGTDLETNGSGSTYIAYLFASAAGVCKVGSYTGTGTTLQINCGFSSSARFLVIKRTDQAGDWYVWDSARGIVAGADPFILLNSANAQSSVTDYIDPYSLGFEISSTAPAAINANGGSFIFLAIA